MVKRKPIEGKEKDELRGYFGILFFYKRIYDNSLTPKEPKKPDFKVSTQYYSVENGYVRLGMGNEDEYFWKTSKERENTLEITIF